MKIGKFYLAFILYLVSFDDGKFVESVDKRKDAQLNYRNYRDFRRPRMGLIDLDIKIKNTNDSYICYVEKTIAIFTPRIGQSIKGVKQKDVEIWNGDTFTGHAKKVLVDGIGKPKKTVTVYLESNERVKFYKAGKNKPWREIDIREDILHANRSFTRKITSTTLNRKTSVYQRIKNFRNSREKEIPESEHPEEIDVVPEEGEEITELTSYVVKKRPEEEVYEYQFKEWFKCIEIKCRDLEVWKLHQQGNYPTSMSYRKEENIIILRFSDGFLLYVKRDERWTLHPYIARILRQYNPYSKKRSIKCK